MRGTYVVVMLGWLTALLSPEVTIVAQQVSSTEVDYLKGKRLEVTRELERWREYKDNAAIKGHIMLKMTEIIATRTNATLIEMTRSSKHTELFNAVVADLCKPEVTCSKRVQVSRYRTIDGSCNNLKYPTRGMTGRPQKRELPVAYLDVIGSPVGHGANGHMLPSAREVSNIVLRADVDNARDPHATVMVMAFGQFLDHDLLLTPTFKGADNSGLACCGNDMHYVSGPAQACHPINIHSDDPHFGQYNITCMNFVRSAPAICNTCEPCGRHPMNAASSYIDASHVYGLTTSQANKLRSYVKGRMKMVNNMLPTNPSRKACSLQHRSQYCLAAGDPRVNVVPNLSSLHLTFVREHNRQATRLATLNPSWSDERVYLETRKLIIAVFQHISYNEYLPIVIGDAVMKKYRLVVSTNTHISGYDEEVDATLGVGFSTAAFRFGHASITNAQGCLDREYKTEFENPIETTYHNPNMTFTATPGLTRWMTYAEGSPTDGSFEKGVRDLLFAKKNHVSADLPAINLQRGRDHGIPSYNAWRKYCGLSVIDTETFNKTGMVMADFTAVVADKFRRAYRHPDDIELFVGAIRETPVAGGQVGPTFACMLGDSFRRLKYGDRFFYEFAHSNSTPEIGFTNSQMRAIKKYKLSKIMCENNDVETIQSDVFRPHNLYSNHMHDCSDLDELDLSGWSIDDVSGSSTNRNSCYLLLFLLMISIVNDASVLKLWHHYS